MRPWPLVLLPLLAGCSVDRTVAGEIRRELPKVLGPADRYEVRVKGTNLRDASVREAWVRATGLRTSAGLRVEELVAQGWRVRVDPRTRRIRNFERLEATVTLTAQDLERYAETKRVFGRVKLERPQLEFPAPDGFRLRGQATFEGLVFRGLDLAPRVPVEVSGRIVGQGTAVRVEVSRVAAIGLDLPPLASDALREAVNPVADLNGLPVRLRLGTVESAGDRVRVRVEGVPDGP